MMTKKPLRILLIEDNPADVLLIQEYLQTSKRFEYEMVHVMELKDVETAMQNNHFQIILLDLNLPDSQGLNTVHRVLKLAPRIPIVVLTVVSENGIAFKAIEAGVCNYLRKDLIASPALAFLIERTIEEELQKQNLIQMTRMYNLLNHVNRASVHAYDTEKLLDEVCRIMIETGEYYAAFITLSGANGTENNYIASAGKLQNRTVELESFRDMIQRGEGEIGSVLAKRTAFITTEVQSHFGNLFTYEGATGASPVSVVALPIIIADKVRGALFIFSDRQEALGEHELDLLNELAGDTSYSANSIEQKQIRNRVEQELFETKERYRNLIENINDVLFETDIRGVFTFMSPVHEHFSGYKTEELIGQSFLSVIHPDDVAMLRSRFENLLRGEMAPSEFRIHTKSGNEIWLRSSSTPIVKDGAVVGIRGMFSNINDRKNAELELARQKYLLEEILDKSPAAIYVKDIEGKYLLINRNFETVSGIPRKEILGKTDADFFPTEFAELWRVHDRQVIETGNPLMIEEPAIAPDGTPVTYFSIKFPLTNDRGEVAMLGGISTDITERKQAILDLERAKELAERNEKLKDAFIANISHEIRTPLNVLMGYSSVIAENLENRLMEEEKLFLRAIENAGSRLMRTVDFMLNISRIEVGDFVLSKEHLNLESIARTMTAEFLPLASEKKLELRCEIETPGAVVLADEYCLTQALSNIVDNAIKYTKQGSILVRLYEAETEYRIDVRDTGIGISTEYLGRLFQPYTQEEVGYSRSYEGIGLGLALVKKYLDLNDVAISVRSTKGVGSCFTLRLKKTGSDVEQTETIPHRVAFLVVEDDPMTQDFMEFVLRDRGYVHAAPTAEKAWEILRRKKIDCIFMDISLGSAKDGIELTREIRQDVQYANVPIIAITAHAFPVDRENCFAAGCNEYFSKPVDRTVLYEVIDKYVGA